MRSHLPDDGGGEAPGHGDGVHALLEAAWGRERRRKRDRFNIAKLERGTVRLTRWEGIQFWRKKVPKQVGNADLPNASKFDYTNLPTSR